MSMHLLPPMYSTTGKKKGKKKFASAEHARKARDLDESWKELQKKWGIEAEEKKRARALAAPSLSGNYSLKIPEGRNTTAHIKSVDTGGNATLAPAKIYTGDQVLGVTVLHKSCLQPVFSKQDAIDAARMRR